MDYLTQIIAIFASSSVDAMERLVPAATHIAYTLSVLSVLAVIFAAWHSMDSVLPAFVQTVVTTTIVAAAIPYWPTLVHSCLESVHYCIGLILGAPYDGPGALFTLANDTVVRVMAEGVESSLLHPIDSTVNALAGVVVGPLIYIGLIIPAFLAVNAELILVVGSAVAPLVLAFCALPMFSSMGMGAVRFLLAGTVRAIAIGMTAAIGASAVTQTLALGGTDHVLDTSTMLTLLGVATFVTMLGAAVSYVSGQIVGGGILGWSGVIGGAANAVTMVSGGVGAAASAASSAANAGAARAAATTTGNIGRSAAGAVGSRSSGSAFSP